MSQPAATQLAIQAAMTAPISNHFMIALLTTLACMSRQSMSEQLWRSLGVAMRKNNMVGGEQTVPKVTTNFRACVARPALVLRLVDARASDVAAQQK